ncbi:MAG: hypothetical protein MJB14_00020 [Spirochaetes bacterium]|nr:hypothetical protein [Spirochaetota bacterium]
MDFFKYFIIFFVAMFLILTFVGFQNGKDYLNDPVYKRNRIFKEVHEININNTLYLVLQSDNQEIATFNIDTNEIVNINKKFIASKKHQDIDDKNLTSYLQNQIVLALGGGSLVLGFEISDLFKNAKSIKKTFKSQKGAGAVSISRSPTND